LEMVLDKERKKRVEDVLGGRDRERELRVM
jgi:hypothetical protein